MKISTIEMTGFKKYIEPTTINFSDVTVISGENGTGKSSIGEAIAFVLFGTDTFGGKINPINLEEPQDVRVKIQVIDRVNFHESDGIDFSLERAIENGKPKLYINNVPTKATEFKELIDTYFSKEQFFTEFNPMFFASQHWNVQRQQFMSNLKEPLIAEVLERAGKLTTDTLKEPLKKLDIDKLELKHKEIKKRTDNEMIKVRERIETYKKTSSVGTQDNVGDLTARLAEVEESLKQNSLEVAAFKKAEEEIDRLRQSYDSVNRQLEQKADEVRKAQDAELLAVCISCGQDLTEEQKEKIAADNETKIGNLKADGKALVAERNALKEKIAAIVSPNPVKDVTELQEERMTLRERIASAKAKDYSQEIEQASTELAALRKENVTSNDILDSVKVYRNAKVELMIESANDMFRILSVKLFKELANGSIESTFELEMNGIPYGHLSTAEKIIAGLELRNAFIGFKDGEGIIAPVFIDNVESISGDRVEDLTEGQVILAKVTNEEFLIETKEREE